MTDATVTGYLYHCRVILEDGRHVFVDAMLPGRPLEVQDSSVLLCEGQTGARVEDIGLPPESFVVQLGTGMPVEWITDEKTLGFVGPQSPPLQA